MFVKFKLFNCFYFIIYSSDILWHGPDYEYSLQGLTEGSSEYSKVKHDVHLRSAQKLQDLCFRNGGIYIKLGQHISQLV